jgi:hypothetical protein
MEEYKMSSQMSLSDEREILPNLADKSTAAQSPEQAFDKSGDPRLSCIRAYEELSLRQPDPLRACLAVVNCGLMDFVAQYHTIIEDALSNGAKSLSDLRQLSSAMDCYLKLVRQTDRFAQMEIRLREDTKHEVA